MSPRAAAEPLASAQRDGATSRKLALECVLHELGDALDQRTTEQPAQAGQIPRAGIVNLLKIAPRHLSLEEM